MHPTEEQQHLKSDVKAGKRGHAEQHVHRRIRAARESQDFLVVAHEQPLQRLRLIEHRRQRQPHLGEAVRRAQRRHRDVQPRAGEPQQNVRVHEGHAQTPAGRGSEIGRADHDAGVEDVRVAPVDGAQHRRRGKEREHELVRRMAEEQLGVEIPQLLIEQPRVEQRHGELDPAVDVDEQAADDGEAQRVEKPSRRAKHAHGAGCAS